WNPADYGGIA
nr:Chain A, ACETYLCHOLINE RECEPTOR [ALA76] MIR ANALOGUE [Tetronarce californica]